MSKKEPIKDLDSFYTGLQTVPRLISDLALSVAEAQRRLDVNYCRNLAEFFALVAAFYPKDKDGKATTPPDQLIALFKTIGPARYQFTETVVEVRADMQMASSSQIGAGVTIGLTVPFAVAVNASYTRRTASDYRASALIRTVLHAVSADPETTEKLLSAAANAPGTSLPDSSPFKALEEALKGMQGSAPTPTPTPTPVPTPTPAPTPTPTPTK